MDFDSKVPTPPFCFMQQINTIFLDWNRPLLAVITERLLSYAKGNFVDLSNLLVIVPTVQSGRRLREALALSSNGLFPPEITTPDGLLEHVLGNESVASETTIVAAWVSVLRSLDFRRFETLFPVVPEQTVAWQNNMARRFVQLRNELGEEGLDFQQVSQFALKSGYEPERWRELAKLETRYLDQIKKHELKDPKKIRREIARDYQLPEQIDRIILAATPDPQPLVLKALESAAKQTSMEVWIYGSEDAEFDSWGRPHPEYWGQRSLDFEAWDVRMQTMNSPRETAAFIVESTRDKLPESILLGLADSALNSVVENAFDRAQIPYYDPGGLSLKNETIGRLIELLCCFYNDPDIETIRSLLQHPDVQEWLNIAPVTNQILKQLDHLFENHLAPDLSALIHFGTRLNNADELTGALEKLNHVYHELKKTKHFARSLAETLQQIYGAKTIVTEVAEENGVPWKECAETIRNQIQLVAETEVLFPKLPKEFIQTVLQYNLDMGRVYPTRPQQAHDILGWLELLWNDAPHLILVGLNEHCVPESITGDSFLPEALREKLGLRTNAQRFARDAYLLEALCRRRSEENGRIDFIIPKTSHDQNPLKPSRLLFLGTEDQLLQRTQKIFQTVSESSASSQRNIAWKLRPPDNLKLPTSLPVSALKSYLQCPFRFFLRHILHMRPLDIEMRELSSSAFGTLFHDTVAKLKGDTFDSTTKSQDLIKKLRGIAKHLFKHRYGNNLSFALRLQYEALMERITAFSEHQCNDLVENGRVHILNTEEAFEISFEGMILKGRIDRIDERKDGLELIDYKTSNQPNSPENAHFTSLGNKNPPEHLPAEAIFEQNDKYYQWSDLQLPMYRLAKEISEKRSVSTAYFNLGQTIEKSGITRWETLNKELCNSAHNCAAAVIKKIKTGVFWPPNQDIYEPYDEFRSLFPDGIENSVDADTFENYKFK